ncbi:MAG: MBL fold metallo-hydrolase [Acidobacteriota bacterium]
MTPTPELPPAVVRHSVGDLRLTLIDDGPLAFPAAALGADHAPADVTAYLEAHGLPTTHVLMSNVAYLVESPGGRLLVDTGLGPHVFPGDTHRGGRLHSALEAIGAPPESIDIVVLTHAHPDHVGGAVHETGEPRFPNARYLVHEREWEFWTSRTEHEHPVLNFMFRVASTCLAPLQDRIETFSGDHDVMPGVRALEAPGHTPGHTALLFESEGDRLLDTVDALCHPRLSFDHPDWALAVDVDPARARDTRRRLLRMAVDERLRILGHHQPFPGIGRVYEINERFGWTPTLD